MHERAVRNERDCYCNVEEREAIQEKATTRLRSIADVSFRLVFSCNNVVDLRRRQPIERHQDADEPENRVHDFDWELLRREEQRKQADVPTDSQWAKGTKVPSVFEREEAEGDDDEQDGFLVHVPAEEEGGVGAEGEGGDEACPGGLEEELDEGGLGRGC